MSSKEDTLIDNRPISALRVIDLKAELEQRGLSKSGGKKELMDRLVKHLESEKSRESSANSEENIPDVNLSFDEKLSQNDAVRDSLDKQQKVHETEQETNNILEEGKPQESESSEGTTQDTEEMEKSHKSPMKMAPKSSPKNTPIHPKKRELSRLASEEALASHNKEERKKERKSSEDKYETNVHSFSEALKKGKEEPGRTEKGDKTEEKRKSSKEDTKKELSSKSDDTGGRSSSRRDSNQAKEEKDSKSPEKVKRKTDNVRSTDTSGKYEGSHRGDRGENSRESRDGPLKKRLPVRYSFSPVKEAGRTPKEDLSSNAEEKTSKEEGKLRRLKRDRPTDIYVPPGRRTSEGKQNEPEKEEGHEEAATERKRKKTVEPSENGDIDKGEKKVSNSRQEEEEIELNYGDVDDSEDDKSEREDQKQIEPKKEGTDVPMPIEVPQIDISKLQLRKIKRVQDSLEEKAEEQEAIKKRITPQFGSKMAVNGSMLQGWYPDVKVVQETEETDETPVEAAEEPELVLTPEPPVLSNSSRRIVIESEAEMEEKPQTEGPALPEQKKEQPRKKRERDTQPKASSAVLVNTPVSPAKEPVSSVLSILNLTRPFTVGQLKKLLSRTGQIVEGGFWIDKVKSRCLVEYTSDEEAVATRDALHGVQWPSSNPKLLYVDYSNKDNLEKHLSGIEEMVANPPQPKPRKVAEKEEVKVKEEKRERKEAEERKVSKPVRQWDLGKYLKEYDEEIKERHEKEEVVAGFRRRRGEGDYEEEAPWTYESEKVTKKGSGEMLDILFRKTKTKPSLYYLPLTDEQIAEKEARRQRILEERARMATTKEKSPYLKQKHSPVPADRRKRSASPSERRSRSTSNRRSRSPHRRRRRSVSTSRRH
ncbi:apoptotic chromatin condensation inducer in the nucleus-like isoform X3 [Artemia franciscana]|uniref:apoptotic chromatin condensation inducer in the nucleus-like isoform X3 n=1 Tax=Artemia franciscana TaxID=6661 RepID=UPI0032DBE36B